MFSEELSVLLDAQTRDKISFSFYYTRHVQRQMEYTEQAFLLRTEGSRVLLVCKQPLLRDA